MIEHLKRIAIGFLAIVCGIVVILLFCGLLYAITDVTRQYPLPMLGVLGLGLSWMVGSCWRTP